MNVKKALYLTSHPLEHPFTSEVEQTLANAYLMQGIELTNAKIKCVDGQLEALRQIKKLTEMIYARDRDLIAADQTIAQLQDDKRIAAEMMEDVAAKRKEARRLRDHFSRLDHAADIAAASHRTKTREEVESQ